MAHGWWICARLSDPALVPHVAAAAVGVRDQNVTTPVVDLLVSFLEDALSASCAG